MRLRLHDLDLDRIVIISRVRIFIERHGEICAVDRQHVFLIGSLCCSSGMTERALLVKYSPVLPEKEHSKVD